MGRYYPVHLKSRCYVCAKCKTHLAFKGHLLSHDYRGKNGPACLFKRVENVIEMEPKTEQMSTGRFIVRHIHCCRCHTYIGWKYVSSYEPSQKFKDGHYILEMQDAVLQRDDPEPDDCFIHPPITFLSSSFS
ncbi:Protein yippee-like [Schizosaccharomyces pombe]|uniref:Protein yippee-like PJ691.02 n=1 Tax=Schizosaccharomyces pombe (strain 972 / ATCC 24843) TaxID=284812 RepID=YIPL_SCHPO|nr:yippee-like protein [Schizosaccharomyces pombe]Q9URW3.1 RecName: Full=Protein yippee-like PJ691.02 [Schizosaccharomyces pombe 972h-]CAB62089.1 yippee-like protein [Schizosaccharomyces pombe]|eukprot:NP_594895.1 yippee-like protein [Schizosaccharomyces pombe]